MNFFSELGNGYRPYLLRFSIDFLVCATIWLVLFLFKVMTDVLPITGFAAKFVVALHSLGTDAAMVIFLFFSVNDIIQIRRGVQNAEGEHRKGETQDTERP
jgi:membrane protein implicated in regulation of membrane protease activity